MLNCLHGKIRTIQTYGLGTIVATSTSHFVALRNRLGFYAPYHPNLRPTLLNFLEQSLPLMGLDIPFRGQLAISYNEDRLLNLREDLFSNLDKIDSSEDICRWILLVENTKKIFRNRIPTNHWKWILLDFATEKISVSDIPLSVDKIKDIKITMMKYRIESLDFRFRDVMDKESYDEWETYLVTERRAESWLVTRMWLYEGLKLWKTLLIDLLTIEEVTELDKWGYENISKQYSTSDYFSLDELRNDLLHHDFSLNKV